jgi:hypothetical protein
MLGSSGDVLDFCSGSTWLKHRKYLTYVFRNFPNSLQMNAVLLAYFETGHGCRQKRLGKTECIRFASSTVIIRQNHFKLHHNSGRAIAQTVSRRLPTAAARVQTRVWSCEILWWTKVTLGQVFSEENFGFPCQSTFHLLLHNNLHYHPRLAQ